MKFQHASDLSRFFKKPVYTYTLNNVPYFLMPQFRKHEKKVYRKTGKAYWYVKVEYVETPPYIRTLKELTLDEALLWAETELFPTRIALLFEGY